MKKHVLLTIFTLFSFAGFSQDCKELFLPTFGEQASYYENDKGFVVEITKKQLKSIKELNVVNRKVISFFLEWESSERSVSCKGNSSNFSECMLNISGMKEDTGIYISNLKLGNKDKSIQTVPLLIIQLVKEL